MRFSIEIAKSSSPLHPDDSLASIDRDAPHPGQVHDQSAVAECTASHIVPAAPNCCEQVMLTRKPDGRDDVGSASASRNRERAFVYACVPDLSGLLVLLMLR